MRKDRLPPMYLLDLQAVAQYPEPHPDGPVETPQIKGLREVYRKDFLGFQKLLGEHEKAWLVHCQRLEAERTKRLELKKQKAERKEEAVLPDEECVRVAERWLEEHKS